MCCYIHCVVPNIVLFHILQEISELRHSQNKLKKAYSEKCQEMEHARSRTEQYELEVKRLRTRVDELKQDLASGEDEVQI